MLLLDTSVLLWLLIDSPRLGPAARRRIATASLVHVSAVSVTELTIKAMLGKITLPDDLPTAVREQSLTELPVSFDHADAIRHFPELVRHDPFDRMLAGQAMSAKLTLLTTDRILLGLGRDFIVDAAV